MKKYLYDYIDNITKKLEKNITIKDREELLVKINFFLHERLIHLLVTLFFSLISIIFTCLCFYHLNYYLIVITLILYIMDLFYIIHYYRLENGVQLLYKLYDEMNKKIK